MSTSGGISIQNPPECSYAPRMTRAAALALRAAGSLNPNCVIVLTDGPVIGTAGNTSVTEIELNPVSATELGMAARVHTTFDNSAWIGTYDIDLGSVGSITRLTDAWNNTAQDSDADAPTVHTQVPWHAGGTRFRDNFFDDSVLPGWSAAKSLSAIADNKINDSSVDLTGVTTSRFLSNVIATSTITLS